MELLYITAHSYITSSRRSTQAPSLRLTAATDHQRAPGSIPSFQPTVVYTVLSSAHTTSSTYRRHAPSCTTWSRPRKPGRIPHVQPLKIRFLHTSPPCWFGDIKIRLLDVYSSAQATTTVLPLWGGLSYTTYCPIVKVITLKTASTRLANLSVFIKQYFRFAEARPRKCDIFSIFPPLSEIAWDKIKVG